MGSRTPLSFFRPLLEISASHRLRSRIMIHDARRETVFTQRRGELSSVPLLSTERVRGSLGPDSGANTFYILGSGASIESLTDEHFLQISRQTSVGINSWGVHPFVPDIYSLESVPWVGDGRDFARSLALLNRDDIYARQPEILILRPKTADEIGNLKVLPDNLRGLVSYYGRVAPATRKYSNLVGDVTRYFDHVVPRYPSVVLDSGASVVRMVVLGIILGFRRIVLAGVDLNESPYFWEKRPEYLLSLAGAPPVNNQVTSTHETLSSLNRPFDVKTMLRALDCYFQAERGGQLLVTSPDSALAEFLPLETWEKS